MKKSLQKSTIKMEEKIQQKVDAKSLSVNVTSQSRVPSVHDDEVPQSRSQLPSFTPSQPQKFV